MALVNFYAVTTLPSTLEPDSLYFVQNGTFAESYITSASGEARAMGNSSMINTRIAQALADFEGGGSGVLLIADDIAARDALELAASTLVLVIDASADATVGTGSALYAWNAPVEAWIKVAEYESMDVVVAWDSITGRPTSSPAQIDSAVSASHTHVNKAVLDDLSDSAGLLRYKGAPIPSEWATKNW